MVYFERVLIEGEGGHIFSIPIYLQARKMHVTLTKHLIQTQLFDGSDALLKDKDINIERQK